MKKLLILSFAIFGIMFCGVSFCSPPAPSCTLTLTRIGPTFPIVGRGTIVTSELRTCPYGVPKSKQQQLKNIKCTFAVASPDTYIWVSINNYPYARMNNLKSVNTNYWVPMKDLKDKKVFSIQVIGGPKPWQWHDTQVNFNYMTCELVNN